MPSPLRIISISKNVLPQLNFFKFAVSLSFCIMNSQEKLTEINF